MLIAIRVDGKCGAKPVEINRRWKVKIRHWRLWLYVAQKLLGSQIQMLSPEPITLVGVNSKKSCEVEPLKCAEYLSGGSGVLPIIASLGRDEETSSGSLPPFASEMKTTYAGDRLASVSKITSENRSYHK